MSQKNRWFNNRDTRTRGKSTRAKDWVKPEYREKFVTRGDLLWWLKQHEDWVKEHVHGQQWHVQVWRGLVAAWDWAVGLVVPPPREPVDIEPPEAS